MREGVAYDPPVLLGILVLVLVMGSATALVLWMHWPDRPGGRTPVERPEERGRALDATSEEVGRAERPEWATRHDRRGLLGAKEPGGAGDGPVSLG